MGSVPEHFVITMCRNNIPTHLWSFQSAKPELRIKLGKGEDLREKLDEKKSTPASTADDVSNWAGHVEAVCQCF